MELLFSKRDDTSAHVRLRTREDRASNTYYEALATYEPFGLSTPTRGNAVFVKVFKKKNIFRRRLLDELKRARDRLGERSSPTDRFSFRKPNVRSREESDERLDKICMVRVSMLSQSVRNVGNATSAFKRPCEGLGSFASSSAPHLL